MTTLIVCLCQSLFTQCTHILLPSIFTYLYVECNVVFAVLHCCVAMCCLFCILGCVCVWCAHCEDSGGHMTQPGDHMIIVQWRSHDTAGRSHDHRAGQHVPVIPPRRNNHLKLAVNSLLMITLIIVNVCRREEILTAINVKQLQHHRNFFVCCSNTTITFFGFA